MLRAALLVRLLSTASLAGAAGASGCSRTPPEPTPTVTTESPARKASTEATPPSGSGSGRCIKKLAETPPPIPPAATPPACPPDPEPGAKLPLAEVTFPEAPAAGRVEVELAKTEHDVQKGLMYRQKMAEDHGMLFRPDERREHTFWMHNTCIPLDMLFIDEDGTIVGIVESAPPLNDGTRTVGCPSLYVLEMNAGWSRKHGVAPGQRVTLPAAIR